MLRPTLVLSCLVLLAACSDDSYQQPMMYQPMYYSQAPGYMGVAPVMMGQPADTVYFALNRATLSPEAQNALLQQLNWLRMNPQPAITIEGYADDRGSEAYNLQLGERRAVAVRDFFVRNGIPAAIIGITSYGKDRPAVLGTDEASRSRNRRTVTVGG